MINGSVAGVVGTITANTSGVGRVVAASLTLSLELGLVLLATLSLFMPRRCSAAAERVLTWLSTWLRRLARSLVRRRWGCLVDGLVLVAGLEVAVCVWKLPRDVDGTKGTTRTVTWKRRRPTTGHSRVLVMRIPVRISRKWPAIVGQKR